MRRRFIACLNKERKIYNYSIGSLAGAVIGFALGVSKGLFWGLGAGAIGLTLGRWIGNLLYRGILQRFAYRHLPYTKDWIDKKVPDSADREEL